MARRRRNAAATIAVVAILVLAHAVYSAGLYDGDFLSGWLLLGTVVFLVLLNLRKKLPVLPLGSAAAWLQFHVYAGWLAIALFVLHVGPSIPDGWLEGTLGLMFVLVAGSGVVGLAISRSFAARLARRGEEVIFERIPIFIARLRKEADDLALRSTRETESTTIADFYVERLRPFFEAPRNFTQHLRNSNRARFVILADIDDMERYLNPKEREFSERLRALVRKKHELDYHYALQATLKGWLFVHIPLTYGLLILAAIHTVLVHALSGGLG